MIPKRIFFIWIGPKKPYVDFCVNTFKTVNNGFDINFQQFKSLNDYNEDLKYCIDVYLDYANNCLCNTTDNIYNQMVEIFKISMGKLKFLKGKKPYTINSIIPRLYATITEAYRFYLLYKYGGIYLDCDTFPNREFDDKFLSLDNVRSLGDIYLLGTKENNKFWFIKDNKDMKSLTCDCPKDENIRQDFFNCRTVYNRDINKKYINHYRYRSWSR